MNKLFAAALVAGLVLAGSTGDAFARSRSVTATGPDGHTISRGFENGCANGTCSRERSVTGPNGNSSNYSRSITRTAPGSYEVERSRSRFDGTGWSRERAVTRPWAR